MMFSRVIVGALVAVLGVVAQSTNVTDEKPFALASPGKLEQCKNTTIVWQGGKSPYKVSIKPVCGAGQNASGEEHIVSTPDATSIEIPITYPNGTSVVVSITDSSNMQATAPAVTIVSSDANDSCIVQTACTNDVQAPDVPVALVSSSSVAPIPTDSLVTAGSSASSSSTEAPTDTTTATESATSMVILYSYVGPSDTNSSPSAPTSPSQSNAAILRMYSPMTAAIVSAVAVVGSHLVLGL
ncbi:hypothetical protein FRC12_002755 [Ceratobasidium sp. 428]|nr:hypothetical protein FRC12_002755 [Ceratobasidium sp. 428]